MARRPGRAKWGEAPARTGRRAMPLGVSLSEGLGRARWRLTFTHLSQAMIERGLLE